MLPKGKIVVPVKEEHEVDSDDGNMLNDLDNDNGSLDFNREDEKEEENDKLFALGNSQEAYNRVTRNFAIAKSRALNTLSTADYLLSPFKRIEEEPL